MIRLLSGQRGVAMIMALMAVSFLVALTIQLIADVDRQLVSSVNLRDSVRLNGVVQSGLSMAMAALKVDDSQVDAPQDSWSEFDQEALTLIADGTRLTLDVEDLSGRLQIHALAPKPSQPGKTGAAASQQQQAKIAKQVEVWKRFLNSGKFAVEDSVHVDSLIDTISDWIDDGDQERNEGAETGYYMSLKKPYRARNDYLMTLDELLLIREMTPDILYGKENQLPMIDYVTIHGDTGVVNINTAPEEVLMSLHQDISEEIAKAIVEFREKKDESKELANPDWYKQVPDFPPGTQLDPDLIGVNSTFFTVRIVAEYNGLSRSGEGVIERDNGEVKLKSWQID